MSKSKRIVALFLILSLAALSGKLTAGERRGAKLQVETKDGNKATGELIAVKQHSLLLMDGEKKAEIPINIADVKEIVVKGKSHGSTGALIGLLTGGGGGTLIGFASGNDTTGFFRFTAGQKALALGGIFGLIGVVTGAVAGSLTHTGSNTILVQGQNDVQIRVIMDDLKSLARVPDFQ